jgi:hypothetical protein
MVGQRRLPVLAVRELKCRGIGPDVAGEDAAHLRARGQELDFLGVDAEPVEPFTLVCAEKGVVGAFPGERQMLHVDGFSEY